MIARLKSRVVCALCEQDAQENAESRIREIEREAARLGNARRDARRPGQQEGQQPPQQQPPQQQPPQQAAAATPAAESASAEAAAPDAPASDAPASAAAEGVGADAGRRMQGAEGAAGASAAGCAALEKGLSDSSFEKIVMDKSKDVFVLFYKPSTPFCLGNATDYGAFGEQLAARTTTALAMHMDVRAHKSPFVFEDSEVRHLPRSPQRSP